MLYIFDNTETLITTLPKGSFFDAVHSEVLNGENTFQFTIPVGNEYVVEGNLVAFRDLDSYWQVFEIKRLVDTHGDGLTRTAYCEHIFYELLDDIVTDKRPSAGATAALAGMLDNTRWQVGTVDDLGASSTSAYYESALSAVQKVANAWHGELNWRCVISGGVITRYVDLRAMVGTDTGKQFAYSKDILSIEREVDTSEVVTALYGRGKGIELDSGSYGRRLTFADVVAADKPAGQEWVGDDDALAQWGRNGRHRFDVFIDEEETDPDKLLEKTRAELARRKIPRITYRLDVVSLEQLTGYEHEKVRKGDLVRVIDREFKPELVVSARVIDIERDILDPANTKVVLGSFAPTIIEATINTARRVDQMANRPFNTKWLDGKISVLQNEIENTQSYVFQTADDGILILDAADYATATKAMKLGGGIFAIANQKDGLGGWSWRTFGDGSGFTADLITAGIIDAGMVQIGSATTFEAGYDPTQIVAGSTVGMGVDADCLGLWHFDGSLNSHKGVAVDSDALFGGGCFGQAVKIEEGTVNLLTANQSSVETDITGFNALTGLTFSKSSNWAFHGNYSLKVIGSTTNSGLFLDGIEAIGGLAYTASFYVKGASGVNLDVYLYDVVNANFVGRQTVSVTADVQRVTTVLESIVPNNTTNLRLYIRIGTPGTYYFDGFQIEQKPYASPFVDGTRLGVLKAPTTGLSASQGTISLRAKNLSASANGAVLVDLPKSDNSQGIKAGIANDGKLYISDSDKVSKSYSETTQADFQSGTLTDVVATSVGDLELKNMGKALSFDGVDDYVEAGDKFDMGTSDMTIECKIKTSHVSATSAWIVSKAVAAGENCRYGVGINNGHVRGFVFGSGIEHNFVVDGAINISDNKTHHVSVAFDRDGNMSVYIDGTLDKYASIASMASVNMQSAFPFRIGAYTAADGTTPSFFFPGIIDDVRIWNVARTQQQIQDNMNKELVGNETGLVGYWKFNEGTGTTANDSTANDNNGTIYGATWVDGLVTSYKTPGTRIKEIDISGANPAGGTKIEWSKTTPAGTAVKVETALSTDGGSTYGDYVEATSGSSIPGITAETNLSNARLKIKETLSTTDTSVTPKLHSLTFNIWEKQASTVYGPNKSTLTAWDSISLAWKSDRLSLVVNDPEACYIENPGLPTNFGSHLFIGTDRNGNNAINTFVDEMRIDKVYRDVAIRTGWHKTGVPFYTSEDMKQWPGYIRAETDGLKVYDSSNALRVLLGSWLKDAIRKYGIKIIDGEMYSSLIRSGAEDATTYIQLIPPNLLQVYSGGKKQLEIDTEVGGRIQFFRDGTYTGDIRGTGAGDVFVLSMGGIDLLATGRTPGVTCGYDLHVSGNFSKTGSYSAIEPTHNYGKRLLYGVESPELLYCDRYVGRLENGEAVIKLDPIFLECIEPDTELTPWSFLAECYGENDVYVVEWGEDWVKVKERNNGNSNYMFVLWIVATRKNYAGIRLMEVVN